MNQVWKTLGLDGPPKNMKALKRAYAKKLKVTRPEEDPEGFMALRDAFNRGQYLVRSAQQALQDDSAPLPEAAAPLPEPRSSSEDSIGRAAPPEKAPDDTIFLSDLLPESSEPEPEIPERSPAAQLVDAVHVMMGHPFKRSEKENWAQIFDDPRVEPMDDWVEFDHRLRDYFLQIFGAYDGKESDNNSNRKPKLISTRIGTYIFDRMDWHDYSSAHLGIAQELAWLREDFGLPGPVQIYPAPIRRELHLRRPKMTVQTVITKFATVVTAIVLVAIVAYFVGIWANARPPY